VDACGSGCALLNVKYFPSDYNALGMQVKQDIETLARCKRRNLEVNKLCRK